MAIQFPKDKTELDPPGSGDLDRGDQFTDTTSGLVYTWNGYAWVAAGSGGGASTIVHYTGPDAPDTATANEGDQWYHTDDGRLYTLVEDSNGDLRWVDASPNGPNYWSVDGNTDTLIPATTAVDVDLGTGDLSAAAGTFSGDITTSGGDITTGDAATGRVKLFNSGRLSIIGPDTQPTTETIVVSAVGRSEPVAKMFGDGHMELGRKVDGSPNITLNANGTAVAKQIDIIGTGPSNIVGRMRVLNPGVNNTLLFGTQTGNDIAFQTANGTKAMVTNTGNFEVGGTMPNNANITLKADGRATFAGTVTDNASDVKFKTNIVEAPAQLSEVKALQLRTWVWKPDAIGTQSRKDRHRVGLVAQEAEQVDAKLVYEVEQGEDDSFKAIDYKVLTMKLLGALQESIARIEALEAEVQQLKGGN